MSEKTTLPATQQVFTKENIPQMLEIIESKLKELGSGSVKDDTKILDTEIDSVCIKNFKTYDECVMAAAKIANSEDAWNAGRKTISGIIKKKKGIDTNFPEFKINKFSAKALQEAIALKCLDIVNAKEIAELKKTKEELSQFLSEEQKLNNVIAGIQSRMTKSSIIGKPVELSEGTTEE